MISEKIDSPRQELDGVWPSGLMRTCETSASLHFYNNVISLRAGDFFYFGIFGLVEDYCR